MRLRHKLLIAHAAVTAIAALAIGQLHLNAQRVAEEYRQVSEGLLPQVRVLEELRAATTGVFATSNELAYLAAVRNTLDPERRREIEAEEGQELHEWHAALTTALAAYAERESTLADHDDALIDNLQAQAREVVAASREFLGRAAERWTATSAGLLATRDRLERAEDEMAAAVDEAIAHETEELAEHEARTTATIAAGGRLVLVAVVLVPVLLLGAGQVVSRTVVRPIGRLTEATARIAAGELVQVRPSRARDEIGDLIAAFGKMTEDLAISQTRARHLALHDPLTDLPNRALLAERLTQALIHARRYGGAAAVLCLDLDRFKEVNDTLGHAVGDLLLREVARRLLTCVRGSDTIARLGGDEFAIVQLGTAQPTDADALCRRVVPALAAPYRLEGHEIVVGTSIGVALSPANGEDPATLLKHADIALYQAKAAGRGTFRFFEESMNLELEARRLLERDLRRAVAEGQFELRYQPQLDLRTGDVVGAEALLRWRHPERGEVAPADFIPLAEETGLIVPIGTWVLHQASAQALAWPALRVAVNLSPVQFRQPGLAELVARILDETGLDPDRLELEITESVLLEDAVAALETLGALKALGVRIAMDDFGTGYSSLGYLRRFPFDKIKIDRSFVADLHEGAGVDGAAIVRAIVALGASLGMTTTAEGIELEAQATVLRAEGCDEVQGYMFGRPMPAVELDRWLARHENTRLPKLTTA